MVREYQTLKFMVICPFMAIEHKAMAIFIYMTQILMSKGPKNGDVAAT